MFQRVCCDLWHAAVNKKSVLQKIQFIFIKLLSLDPRIFAIDMYTANVYQSVPWFVMNYNYERRLKKSLGNTVSKEVKIRQVSRCTLDSCPVLTPTVAERRTEVGDTDHNYYYYYYYYETIVSAAAESTKRL